MSDEHRARQAARQRLATVLGDRAGPPPTIYTRPEPPSGQTASPDPAGSGPVGQADPVDQSGESPAPGAGGALTRLTASAFDPGRPGLRALAAVAVVVLAGAAALAWWSRPRPEPVAPQLAITAAPAAVSPTAPAVLVVAVSGEVREPGLVELPPGARVADAVEAAGGLLPDADIDHLNLARKVVDGELIAVGIPPPPGAAGGPPGAPGAAPGSGAKVNLNTATLAELQILPGIGPALAQRIIDYRTANGPFGSVEELREVSGIGEVRFAELADLVTV